jgi:hypothetical protein
MSLVDRVEQQLKQHVTAIKALEGISQLVKTALVDPKSDAYTVIQIIERVIDTLIAGFDGKVTRAEVEDVITKMLQRRTSRDARFDDALDDKFDGDSIEGEPKP